MKVVYRWSLLVFLSLLVTAAGAGAQWKIVAPNLFSSGSAQGSAMSYRAGIAWIATRDTLYRSIDSGMAWTGQPLPPSIGYVYDLDFFDQQHGLIASTQGAFVTSDGGGTWNSVFGSSVTSACFGNSPAQIAIAPKSARVQVTTNSGTSWNAANFTGYTFCIRPDASPKIHSGFVCFSGGSAGAFLYRTIDDGISWQQAATGIDWDSFTFAIDSCDDNRVYLAHEDAISPTDSYSKLFLTTDAGNSWQATISLPQPYFSGSIAEGKNVVYCPTVTNGVFCSVDRGATWNSTGGPNILYDTRMIAAIDDNTVLAADNNGNVWKMSGNLIPVPISTASLFTGDTVHCDSLTRPIEFHFAGCTPLSVVKAAVIGPDSASFVPGPITSDSLLVTFVPRHAGAHNARLLLTVSDGSIDTILLGGYNAIATFSFAPTHLFSSDSLYSCTSPVRAGFVLNFAGCRFPTVVSERVTGTDSGDYSVVTPASSPLQSSDSIVLVFAPQDSGSRTAAYELTLDDGMSITVPLEGYSIPARPLTLAVSNEQTNTLGGSVQVQLRIDGLARPEDVELQLRYGPNLVYRGSVSTANVPLDVPGESWQNANGGGAKLLIPQVIPGAVCGYARFDVFNDSDAQPLVLFDSVSVPTALALCEYSSPATATSTITPPTGCGMQMLSQFVHFAKLPVFRIQPNPTGDDIAITSSLDLGESQVAVYDMLGTLRGNFILGFEKEKPCHLTIPGTAGLYYLRISSPAGIANLRVVVDR